MKNNIIVISITLSIKEAINLIEHSNFNIALLGKIPFETEVSQQGDQGLPFILKYPESDSAKAFKEIVKKIRKDLEK